MGGSGKTTLARKIYNHSDVQSHFEAFAWVSVTQECRSVSVWRDVFEQLVPSRRNEVKNMREQSLVSELVRLQKEKKCLVILDDIWSVDDWKIIRPAFMVSGAGISGIILLITRTKQVAEVGIAHQLNCLSEKDGWELFKKVAFGSEAVKDAQNFVDMGKQVVRKCGGHPLAICVIGGILRESGSLVEWEKLKQNMDFYLIGNSESSTRDGYGEIGKVLGLSYDHLPCHLKPCMLYLASFLEDSDIDLTLLYGKWIADGMISSNALGREETKMEVAERYLGELADRSMVQLQMILRFKTCRLHDVMREFALAQVEEDGFVRVMDLRSRDNVVSSSVSSNHEASSPCSRLAIYIGLEGTWSRWPVQQLAANCHELRSLLLIGSCFHDNFPCLPKEVVSNFATFKQIRVLELQNLEFDRSGTDKLHKVLETVIHLRYLGLVRCQIGELPSGLGSLPYLEILNLVDLVRNSRYGSILRPACLVAKCLVEIKAAEKFLVGPTVIFFYCSSTSRDVTVGWVGCTRDIRQI